jgi:hypothetical protein
MVDVPLGTLIFRAGLLAEEQLEDALQDGMRTGKRLGEVLLERGWLHERDLGRLLAGQKGLPFVEVRASDAEPAALALLPEEKARLQIALPLRHEDGQLVVAVADPSNELVVENLRRALGSEPQFVVAAQGDLIRAINEAYAPQSVVVAPSAEQPAPEPQPQPSLQVEVEPAAQIAAPAPIEAPAPIQAPAPLEAPAPIAAPAPTAAPAVPTPMPTVLPPAEERVAEPQVAPLQPLLAEPAALEQHPIVPPVPPAAPVVEQPLPAPLSEPPAAQPEPVLAADPAPLLQAATPAPEPGPAPAPLLPPVESDETQAPVAEVLTTPELQPDVAPPPLPVEQPLAAAVTPEPLAEQVEVPPPMVSAEPEPAPAPTSIHAVLIRLREGDVLEVGTFPTAAEAAARAQDVVRQIAAAEGEATWPFFGERYLRPDAIVSVDLHEDAADQWLGSRVRSHWAEQS